MADPFLGEIRMLGFNFPPQGWAKCDGATLNITQNQALYSLLGTRYGGDGRTTSSAGLRGVWLHAERYTIGQKGGAERSPYGRPHPCSKTCALALRHRDSFKPAYTRSLPHVRLR